MAIVFTAPLHVKTLSLSRYGRAGYGQPMKDLAQRLWQARLTGGVIALEDVAAPATMEEAYAVQDEIMRLSGQPVGGFKVGSTSQEAQRALGTTEPGSCPIPASYLHASPARIALAPAQAPAVEGEIAFRLGRDLPPRAEAYGRDDVVAAIDAVAGAVEVVGSRLEGGLSGKGRFLITADSGANIGLVLGKWTTDWRGLDLKAQPVAMTIDGQPRGAGTGARALGDPLNVMVWLANQQSRRGRGLEKGLCVSTGTCTGLDPVKPGDTAVADFGSLGKVEIAFA
jgi:2-keto-4-pentenoate hydratase